MSGRKKSRQGGDGETSRNEAADWGTETVPPQPANTSSAPPHGADIGYFQGFPLLPRSEFNVDSMSAAEAQERLRWFDRSLEVMESFMGTFR
ncbi:hypothetical protein LINPERHAP1_LOCUS37375, partial [Linum perenne]